LVEGVAHELALTLDDEVISINHFGEGLEGVPEDEHSALVMRKSFVFLHELEVYLRLELAK
jgi:hypothetical protein